MNQPNYNDRAKASETITEVIWQRNGDHPDDYVNDVTDFDGTVYTAAYRREHGWEGEVIRYYRHPGNVGAEQHASCGRAWNDHGWMQAHTRTGGVVICPGSKITIGERGDDPNARPATERIYAQGGKRRRTS